MNCKNFKIAPEYVAGFIDGEGCFELGVSRSSSAKLRYGWRPRVRFAITQNHRGVLVLIQNFFGCGHVNKRLPSTCYDFYISHRKQILEMMIPILDDLPLIVKQSDYAIWREAAILLGPGKTWHTPETYHRYLDLRDKINPGRGRRRKVSMETLREAIQ